MAEAFRPVRNPIDAHEPANYASVWAMPEAHPVLRQTFRAPCDVNGNSLTVILAYGPEGHIVFRQSFDYGNVHEAIRPLPELPSVATSRTDAKALGEQAIEDERGRFAIVDAEGVTWDHAWTRRRALAKIAKRFAWRHDLSVVDLWNGSTGAKGDA